MSKWQPSKRQGFFFLALIAVLIRLLFFSGLFAADDFGQALRVQEASSAIQRGELAQARVAIGGIKEGIIYAPYVALDLLGVNGFRFLIPTLIFSIANLYVFYRLVRQTFDENSAAIACLLLAFLPVDVFYATASLKVAPGVFFFLATLWAGSIVIAKRTRWTYAVFAICFVALVLWEPGLALTAAVVAVAWLSQNTRRKSLRYAILLLPLLAIFLVWPNFGELFVSFVQLIQSAPESLIFIPLLFVVLASSEAKDREKFRVPLVLIAAVILYGVIFINRTMTSSPVDQPVLGSLVLIFYSSCAMLGGKFFGSRSGFKQAWPIALIVAAAGAIAAGLAWAGSYAFIPQPNQSQPLGVLFAVYAIVAGVAFLAVVVAPVLLAGRKPNSILVGSILVLIILSNLSFAKTKVDRYAYFSRSLASAGDWIVVQDLSPVYSLDAETYNASEVLVQNEELNLLDPSKTADLDFGYVLLMETDRSNADETWAEIARFGVLGKPRAIVYQVATPSTALDLAQSDAGTSLVADLINAELFCQAYATWSTSEIAQLSFLNIAANSNCVQTGDSLVATEELQRGRNMRGFINYELIASDGQPDQVTLSQASRPVLDMGTSGVTLNLDPNSVYLYSIDIQTEGLTGVLYYADKEDKDYLTLNTFPEWTTVAVLLKTPKWDSPHAVYLSPAIFDHLEDVNLRNFFVGKVLAFNEAP